MEKTSEMIERANAILSAESIPANIDNGIFIGTGTMLRRFHYGYDLSPESHLLSFSDDAKFLCESGRLRRFGTDQDYFAVRIESRREKGLTFIIEYPQSNPTVMRFDLRKRNFFWEHVVSAAERKMPYSLFRYSDIHDVLLHSEKKHVKLKPKGNIEFPLLRLSGRIFPQITEDEIYTFAPEIFGRFLYESGILREKNPVPYSSLVLVYREMQTPEENTKPGIVKRRQTILQIGNENPAIKKEVRELFRWVEA